MGNFEHHRESIVCTCTYIHTLYSIHIHSMVWVGDGIVSQQDLAYVNVFKLGDGKARPKHQAVMLHALFLPLGNTSIWKKWM